MSGSNTGRAPRTEGEWGRDTRQRIKALENPATVRIGSWVLSERDGELVATTPGRAPVVLTAVLAEADTSGLRRIQRLVTVSGTSGGQMALVYRGEPTSAFAWNAPAATVLNAILALRTSYTALDFDVVGPNGGPWLITLPGGSLDYDATLLTGSGPTVQITVPA